MGGETKDEQPKPSKRRLKSLSDTRRFLADVINAVNRDETDVTKGSKLAYMVSILGRLIEQNELERRVAVLEAELQKRGGE